MQFSSGLLEKAVNEFSKLPGIGSKTALRLILHLLDQSEDSVEKFTSAIMHLRKQVKFCSICGYISDNDTCEICENKKRDHGIICIVESSRDIMAIENAEYYKGIYHVLGGLISPMNGIGPMDLNIESLINRLKTCNVKELILAINPTIEGDTTAFYLYKKLKDFSIKISVLARGIASGGEIEYADENTLVRSIRSRIPYNCEINTNK